MHEAAKVLLELQRILFWYTAMAMVGMVRFEEVVGGTPVYGWIYCHSLMLSC
jgi:hypothetical protein